MYYDYKNKRSSNYSYISPILENGYFQLPFELSNSIHEPNIIQTPSQHKYNVKNIYIFRKATDNLDNYDAILCIEHASLSLTNKKLYVLIPIKTEDKVKTQLDYFIEGREPIHLQSIFHTTSFPAFIDASQSFVFVDIPPLPVKTNFQSWNADAFYSIITKKPIKIDIPIEFKPRSNTTGSIIEGLTTNDDNDPITKGLLKNYSLECSPATVDDNKTSMVMLNDAFVYNYESSKIMFTLLNFIYFIIIIITFTFVVPILYRGNIALSNKMVEGDGSEMALKKSGVSRMIDIISGIVFFCIALLFITIGGSKIKGNYENKEYLIVGLIILFSTIFSETIVYCLKLFFQTTYNFSIDIERTSVNISEFFTLIGSSGLLDDTLNPILISIAVWFSVVVGLNTVKKPNPTIRMFKPITMLFFILSVLLGVLVGGYKFMPRS